MMLKTKQLFALSLLCLGILGGCSLSKEDEEKLQMSLDILEKSMAMEQQQNQMRLKEFIHKAKARDFYAPQRKNIENLQELHQKADGLLKLLTEWKKEIKHQADFSDKLTIQNSLVEKKYAKILEKQWVIYLDMPREVSIKKEFKAVLMDAKKELQWPLDINTGKIKLSKDYLEHSTIASFIVFLSELQFYTSHYEQQIQKTQTYVRTSCWWHNKVVVRSARKSVKVEQGQYFETKMFLSETQYARLKKVSINGQEIRRPGETCLVNIPTHQKPPGIHQWKAEIEAEYLNHITDEWVDTSFTMTGEYEVVAP